MFLFMSYLISAGSYINRCCLFSRVSGTLQAIMQQINILIISKLTQTTKSTLNIKS